MWVEDILLYETEVLYKDLTDLVRSHVCETFLLNICDTN